MYTPVFVMHFIQSSKTVKAVRRNELESLIYLEIGKLEFLVVFATFAHVAGLFEQSTAIYIY